MPNTKPLTLDFHHPSKQGCGPNACDLATAIGSDVVTVQALVEYHFVAMAKAFVLPSFTRRRGNPNWGRPPLPLPAVATEFEVQVRQLRLTMQNCASSTELRRWCEHNRNRCYVPEWLLEEWGILVDFNFSG